MVKDTTQAVKDSRARRGVTPTSFAFNEAEKDLLDAVAEKLGVSKKEALIAGLKALSGRARMSKDELVAEIARRIK